MTRIRIYLTSDGPPVNVTADELAALFRGDITPEELEEAICSADIVWILSRL